MLKKIDKTRVEAEKVRKVKEQNYVRHEERMKAVQEAMKEQENKKAVIRRRREQHHLAQMASKLKLKKEIQLQGIETRNQVKIRESKYYDDKLEWFGQNRVQASILHDQQHKAMEKRQN